MQVVVSGYYGFQNMGDEAILFAIIKSFPEIKFYIASAKPEFTSSLYEVSSFNRIDLKAIKKHLSFSDVLISGGGGLLQDKTSLKSLVYYLGVMWLGKILGKRTVVYAQGIGPITTIAGRVLVRTILNKVDEISVRDRRSLELLKELKITRPPCKLTADPVFSLYLPDLNVTKALLTEENIPFTPMIGIAVRQWKDKLSLNLWEEVCRKIQDKLKLPLLFLPFHYPFDLQIARKLVERVGGYTIARFYHPQEFLSLFNQIKFLVGIRLHSIIMGAIARVPTVGVAYDPKVKNIAKELGIPVLPFEFTPEELLKILPEVEPVKEGLLEKMRKREEINHSLLIS